MNNRLLPLVIGILILMFMSCSISDVTGTYKQEGGSLTLQLTKDKKAIVSNSDIAADYSIDGDKIILSTPIMGGIVGQIKGDKLIFPSGDGYLPTVLAGTWVKE